MEAKIRALQGPTPAFVIKLQRLPLEIVHQILDCLPLFKVLNLLAHKTPYAEKCVLTHRYLGLVFKSPPDIASVIDYFLLFRDIRIFHRQTLKDNYLIALNYSMSGYEGPSNYDIIEPLIDEMISDIRGHLRLELPDIDLIRSSTDFPAPLDSSFNNLLNRWFWITDAKEKMNITKANQWNKAADLLEAYPAMLKKPLDPSQDGPRPNTAHIANRFRGNAKRCLRDRKLVHPRHRPQARWFPCVAGVDLIELVPYDRYLWVFLDTLKKHPPVGIMDDLSASLQSISLSLTEVMGTNPMPEGATGQMHGENYRYPPDTADNIRIAMDGLFYVYTGSTLLIVPRIHWPAAMEPDFDNYVQNPRFFIDPKPHPATLPAEFHRCPVRECKPHDDREYKWLEAFLKALSWMQKEFGSSA
ncbi:hypothetical protein BGZ57DRAFT_441715 [Hyaloscypha finlandica]|nr:hypothetical protein BGZ57DRAFT_441715 [Hyaloscypha finlandica]